MTAEERDELHDLFHAAMESQSRAACRLIPWQVAHATDDAFVQALYAIEVTP